LAGGQSSPPTWVRLARIRDGGLRLKTAASEGISDVSWQARARWVVVDHFADCVVSACSRAGVVAFVVSSTGKRPVTVGVDDTFRSAASVGVSKVFWATCALATGASH